jgi:MurNAc alpha-1-phosphate uridylyltransferase
MIFAAGLGTRMGALTRDRPKPLLPVAGQTLLDRTLDLAAGQSPIVCNTHHLADQIEAYLTGRGVVISHEPDLLDTGGGLCKALPLFDRPAIFTMNSDAVFAGPNPLQALTAAWTPERHDALLLVVPLDRAVARAGGGDFDTTRDGTLSRGGSLVYTGVQILKTTVLEGCPDGAFSLNLIWDRLNARRKLAVATYPGHWCDVGHPEGITAAEAMLADV